MANEPTDYISTTSLAYLNIVNFGDSIFGNVYANYDNGTISDNINVYFGATTYNVAVGGTRMSKHSSSSHDAFSMYNLADAIYNNSYTLQESVASSLDKGTTILNTLKSIDFNNINYITIAFGTNDYSGGINLENSSNSLDTNTYIGAARYSINKLNEKYPNTKIILLTPIYRTNSNSTDSFSSHTFMDYGNSLKTLATEYDNVYVFDGLTDLVHPNIYGLRLYAYKLGKYIESLES